MAVVTLPSDPGGWRKVTGVPSLKRKSRFISPFTDHTQTFIWAGESFAWAVELPPLERTPALLWIKALRDLEIADNTFVADMTDYLSSDISGPTTFSLRIIPGSAKYERDRNMGGLYVFTFQMEKAQ